MSDSDSEKTEPATPERRKKAREEGQFARAKDAGATVGTIAVLVCLAGMAPGAVHALRELCVRAFGDPTNLMRGDPMAMAWLVGPPLLGLILPTAVAGVIVASAVGFAEAGYHPNAELAAPKWSRLDPVSKLGSMFSPREMAFNSTILLLRVGVVGAVVYLTLEDELPRLLRLARADLPTAVAAVAGAVFRLGMWASLSLVVIGALDYLQNWFSLEKKLMMSRQELKDEHKQQEGDPQVKGRQRARAREMARRGLMKQLKRSDVVVANPTHVSVALRYRAEEGAPVVTVKALDDMALHMREVAKELGIPIVENVPLARTLYARVKAGRTIPVDLYRAVAEVLAFVYRIKAKGRGFAA
jgi:flagellar biosynthetic protein FlhB